MSVIGKLVNRIDGWANTLTGFGTSRDKVASARFYRSLSLSDELLEGLFYGDDLANRIVSALVDEAMRQGFEVEEAGEGNGEEGDGDDVEDALWDDCERLGLLEKATEAAKWGRLFGGGALWVGANDGALTSGVLNEEAVRSVDFLHVLDKRDLTPLTYYSDALSPMFGKVETYRVDLSSRALGQTSVDAIVHESRLVLFPGVPTSARERAQRNSWDHSALQSVYEVLLGTNSNWQAVQHLMTDASQAVYKVKGLIELLAAGQEDTMRTRMETVEMGRSVSRAIVLDAEGESFERIATPMTGLPEVIDKTWQRLAAAARMPVTVLMGMSPAGMNATGESDARAWYDQVRAYQEQVMRPRLLRVLRLLAIAQKSDPLAWDVCFPSLWQTTEKEKAEVRKLVADTDAVYLAQGVLLPEEVALSRFGASGYSVETHVDLEARQVMLEAETQKAVEGAGRPDPVPPPPFGGAPATEGDEPAAPVDVTEEEGDDAEAA
jgi:uncharacterized protein